MPVQVANQTRERGILDVTIDEQGRVISAAIRVGAAPDLRLADSRRRAGNGATSRRSLNGRPVKFRKIIQITVTKR